MAVSHDAATESTSQQSVASQTISHAGAASGVKGAWCIVIHNSSTDIITGVTYGGVAMTAVTGGRAVDTATEPGSAKLYYLGSNVPQGTNDFVMSRTNNTNWSYIVGGTVLAAKDTEVTGIVLLQENGTLAQQSVNDGSPGSNSLRFAGGHSGLTTSPGVGANSTLLHEISGHAGGLVSATVCRETTAGQGARSVGFSSGTSDDRAFVHWAVREKNTSLPMGLFPPKRYFVRRGY